MKRKIVLVGFLVVLLSVFTCIWLGALHVGAIDAEQISNTEQNTVEMQSSDDELILEEGVYRIRNILKHEYLTVPDFCIDDFSEVRCVADSRRYYQVTKYEKNALWWVSHISGNQYSIRPLHKVNMALDLADDGVSVQIYNVGASISTIYTSRWAVSQPEDWLDSEVYTLCQMNNEDKTLCANSAGTVYTCDYEVSGATGWLFERLDDEQEEELEGIIIYGDFGVKAGSTKRLQAGVFSRTSLSQSVTYSIASGYSGISVTSAGYLTGTSVGPSRVKAVSTVNSRITGYADVAVSSEDDVCATLIGIPSSDEHDHTSYMSNAATCLRGIYGSGSIISKKEAVDSDDEVLSDIMNSKVFIFRGHGEKAIIWFGDNNMYSHCLTTDTINATMSREFSNTELVLYMCCLAGEGGAYADNIVRATYNNGAKNTIGFNVSIDCGSANLWIRQFMDRLAYSAYTVGEITESDIRSALIGIDYSQCNFNSSNIVYLTTSA